MVAQRINHSLPHSIGQIFAVWGQCWSMLDRSIFHKSHTQVVVDCCIYIYNYSRYLDYHVYTLYMFISISNLYTLFDNPSWSMNIHVLVNLSQIMTFSGLRPACRGSCMPHQAGPTAKPLDPVTQFLPRCASWSQRKAPVDERFQQACQVLIWKWVWYIV